MSTYVPNTTSINLDIILFGVFDIYSMILGASSVVEIFAKMGRVGQRLLTLSYTPLLVSSECQSLRPRAFEIDYSYRQRTGSDFPS